MSDIVPNVHRASADVIHWTALGLNLILLHFIVKHSQFPTNVYKHVLGLSCCSDLFLALSAIICQPVCFVSDGYMACMAEGAFSEDFDLAFLTLLIWIAALLTNIFGVGIQFAYRYRFVCLNKTRHTVRSVILLGVLPLVYAACGVVIIAKTIVPTQEYTVVAQNILREIPWNRPDGSIPHAFGSHIMEPIMWAYSALWMTTAVGAYSVVVWTEWRMIMFLNRYGTAMIESTRRMHTEVHRALIATALSPLLSCGPAVFFVSCFVFKISPGPVTAFAISVYNLIAVVNPIMQIYFVRSYRSALLSLLSRIALSNKRSRQVSAASEGAGHADLNVAESQAIHR